MGVFRQKIRITNSADMAVQRAGYITPDEVRTLEVEFLIDTGAYMMCINQGIAGQLGLTKLNEETVQFADGRKERMDIVGPIEVTLFNRRTTCDAIVLPGDNDPLFGSIPLEALDLLVDSREGTLKLPPDRPYIAETIVK